MNYLLSIITPELAQMFIALMLSFIGVLVGFLRMKSNVAKVKADADARNDKNKAEALARESKIRAEADARKIENDAAAERIQQNAQTILNELSLELRSEISGLRSELSGVQANYNTLITNNASLASSHTILKQSFTMLETTHKAAFDNLTRQYDDALAEIALLKDQLKHFGTVQETLQQSEQARAELLVQITALTATVAVQDQRIETLETQVVLLNTQIELEKTLRAQSEDEKNALVAQMDDCMDEKERLANGDDKTKEEKQ